MDNTEKSVIIQKDLNTVPPFRNLRSVNSGNQAGKKHKSIIIVFTLFMAFIAVIITVNAIDSNIVLGFEPVTYVSNADSNEHYYTAAYNDVFAWYKEKFDITVNVMDIDSHKINVPMMTVSEIVSTYISPLYVTDGYEVSVPLDSIVESELAITIAKVDWKEYVVDMVVESEMIYVDSQTIPKGTEVTIQSGQDGHVTRTMKDKYVNGEYDSSIVAEEIVNIPTINEIIYRGVGGTFTSPSGVTYEYSYYIDVTATAYGVDTGYGGDSDYTYTGKLAGIGVIAVDPQVVPLGSKLYVTSDYMDHGICYAEDIGSAIIGNHIDVHLGDDLEAQLAFGHRNARVYVLD